MVRPSFFFVGMGRRIADLGMSRDEAMEVMEAIAKCAYPRNPHWRKWALENMVSYYDIQMEVNSELALAGLMKPMGPGE